MMINTQKDMMTVASSIQGYSHIKNDVPNQDSYSYIVDVERDVFVAIVSDGAGSASNAKLGSSLCCRNLTQRLFDLTCREQTASISWNEQALNLLIEHLRIVAGLPDGIKSYHHTLSAVILSKNGNKVIQVGDSPVVILQPTKRTIDTTNQADVLADYFANSYVIDEKKQGGYANLTTFLTSQTWQKKLKMEDLPPDVVGCLIMSDGAGSVFTQKKQLFVPAVTELFNRFNKFSYLDTTLNDFLSMDDVAEITGDDKTLIAHFPRRLLTGVSQYSPEYQDNNISDELDALLASVVPMMEVQTNLTPHSSDPNHANDIPMNPNRMMNTGNSQYDLDKNAFEKNQVKSSPSSQSIEADTQIDMEMDTGAAKKKGE